MNEQDKQIEDVILLLRPPIRELGNKPIKSIADEEMGKIARYARELSLYTNFPLPIIAESDKERTTYWRAALLKYIRVSEKNLIDSLKPRFFDFLAKGKLDLTPEKLKKLQAYLALLGDYTESQNRQFLSAKTNPTTPEQQIELSRIITEAEVEVSTTILHDNLKDFTVCRLRSPLISFQHKEKNLQVLDALTLFGYEVDETPTFSEFRQRYFMFQKQFHPNIAAATHNRELIAEAESASQIINNVWSSLKSEEQYQAYLEGRAAQLREITENLPEIQTFIRMLHEILERTRTIEDTTEEIPDYYLLVRASFDKQPSRTQLQENSLKARNMINGFYIHPTLYKNLFLELHDLYHCFVSCEKIFADPEKKKQYDEKYRKSSPARKSERQAEKAVNTKKESNDSEKPVSPELQKVLNRIRDYGIAQAKDLITQITSLRDSGEKQKARTALSEQFEARFSFSATLMSNNFDGMTKLYDEIKLCEFLLAQPKRFLLLKINELARKYFDGKLNALGNGNLGSIDGFKELFQLHRSWNWRYLDGNSANVTDYFREKLPLIVLRTITSSGHSPTHLTSIWEFYRLHRGLLEGEQHIGTRDGIRAAFAERADKNFRTAIIGIRNRADYDRVEKELNLTSITFFSGGHRFFDLLRKDLRTAGLKLQR